jgi:hypothetical protein
MRLLLRLSVAGLSTTAPQCVMVHAGMDAAQIISVDLQRSGKDLREQRARSKKRTKRNKTQTIVAPWEMASHLPDFLDRFFKGIKQGLFYGRDLVNIC